MLQIRQKNAVCALSLVLMFSLLFFISGCGQKKAPKEKNDAPEKTTTATTNTPEADSETETEAAKESFALDAIIEGAEEEEEAARLVAEAFILNTFSDYVAEKDFVDNFPVSEGLANLIELRRAIRLTEFSSDMSIAGFAINQWRHYEGEDKAHRFFITTYEVARPHNETVADYLGNIGRAVNYVVEVEKNKDSFQVTRAIADDYSGVAIFPEIRPTQSALGGVLHFDLAKVDDFSYSKTERQNLKAELLKGKEVGLEETIAYEENRIKDRNEACAAYLKTLKLSEINQEAVDRFLALHREVPLLSPVERIEAAAYLPGDMFRAMHAKKWNDITVNRHFKLKAKSDGSLSLYEVDKTHKEAQKKEKSGEKA